MACKIDDKNSITNFEDILAGGIANIVTRFCISPLDVIKIRQQLDHGTRKTKYYKSFLGCTKDIQKNEGICAFWRGNLAATYMYVLYGTSGFYTERRSRIIIQKYIFNDITAASLISGSLAGIAGTLISYPFDCIRTRLAAIPNKEHLKLHQILYNTYKYTGLRGFYDGVGSTLLSIIPYMGLQFSIYNTLKQYMDTTAYIPKYMVSFICGGISGVASKFLTMPFDVLKKRYQILRFESNSVYMQPSYIPSWKLYYNPVTSLPSYTSYNEGLHGLYRGTVPSILKAASGSAILFTIYDYLLYRFIDKRKISTE